MLTHAMSTEKKPCKDYVKESDVEWYETNYGAKAKGAQAKGDDGLIAMDVVMPVLLPGNATIGDLKRDIKKQLLKFELRDVDNTTIPSTDRSGDVLLVSDIKFGKTKKLWLESLQPSPSRGSQPSGSRARRAKPY